MGDAVLLNFDQLEPSTRMNLKLYRYLEIDDFLRTLKDKSLRLRKPHLWKDTFENIFMQSEVIDTDGKILDWSLTREQIYAQCWTIKEESDLMWKSYIKDSYGVKVSTTIRQMSIATLHLHFAFIGKVKYLTEEEIEESFSHPISLSVTEDVIFSKSLLIKREQFEDEREVRLVFCDFFRNHNEAGPKIYILNTNKNEYMNETVTIPIIPNEFFNEVIVDPRLENNESESVILRIREHGYTGLVKRSTLYEFPKIKIVVDMKSNQKEDIT